MGSGLYFFILSIKIIPRDSKNTRASQYQSPALVHQGTVQGPIIGPYNYLTFCRLGVYRWPFSYLQTGKRSDFDEEGGAMILTFNTDNDFIANTFSTPFVRLATTFWISWYYNMNQGTPLDLLGPQMDPEMNPERRICGEPCQKKVPQASF